MHVPTGHAHRQTQVCAHPCTHRRPHCCILWVLLSNPPETDPSPLHHPPPPEILHPQVSRNSGPSPGGLCSAPARAKPLGSQREKPTMSSLYHVGAPEDHRAVTRSEEAQEVRSQEGEMPPRHYLITIAVPFHRTGSRGTERASGLAKGVQPVPVTAVLKLLFIKPSGLNCTCPSSPCPP